MGNSFDIDCNALLGSAPAARASPVAIVAYYLYTQPCRYFPCAGNSRDIAMCPRFRWGQGWRKGIIITMKRDFLKSTYFHKSGEVPSIGKHRKASECLYSTLF